MATELSIDWISITAHRMDGDIHHATHPCLHDWEHWALTNGVHGYNQGASHDIGVKAYRNDSRVDMGTHVIYSGKTLAKLEGIHSISAWEVLAYHVERGDSIARIDLALDFTNTLLTVEHFKNSYMKGDAVTALRTASEVKSLTHSGHTFYIGSRKKRKKLVRIYDKRAEANLDYDCIRVEAQIMGKPATLLSKEIGQARYAPDVVLGAIREVIDFPMIDLWCEAMGDSSKVELASHHDKETDTRKWLNRTVFMSILKEGERDKEWLDEFLTSLMVEARKKGLR